MADYSGRQARGRGRLHGRLARVRRDALVHGRCSGTEQVSFSWRSMPAGTGGRGSYGHRHPGQEEIYFVIAGRVTFKVDDDVFEAGPQTAVRIGEDAFRSVHNDTDEDAELVLISTRDPDAGTERNDDFWPES